MTTPPRDLIEASVPPTFTIPPDVRRDIETIGRIAAITKILEVVCKTTSMGFAAVARVTETHWVACAVRDESKFGLLPGSQLNLESTLCNDIRRSGKSIVIDSVQDDKVYNQHYTPALFGFESYISVPIYRTNGSFFGTLCALDQKPSALKARQIEEMFAQFATLISFYLDAEERLTASNLQIEEQQEADRLREQFVAVLAHDLRNPLAAISAGARLLQKESLSGTSVDIIRMVQQSVSRMAGLIDDVTDFARTRAGSGFQLVMQSEKPLAPVLAQVLDELRATAPDRPIESRFTLSEPIEYDQARMGQLMSNLVANAIRHGAPQTPIQVTAATSKETLELTVSNQGTPIPPEAIGALFDPFFRVTDTSGEQGLGLGLYITSEIVKGHGGTIVCRQAI